MQIESSAVVLTASYSATQFRQESERLELKQADGDARPGVRARGPGHGLALGIGHMRHTHHHGRGDSRHDHVELSDEARKLDVRKGELGDDDIVDGMTPQESFRTTLLKRMVEAMTGKSIKTVDPAELTVDDDTAATGALTDPATAAPGRRGGFGLRYEYRAVQYESEQLSFRAEGVATTADGREISFNVALNMSREFYRETAVTIEAGRKLKDPLVLNFDGNAAEFGERDFSFDIDLDGHVDQIAFVGAGSGFLALDRNEDGEINDGSELFGPHTGDGFAELAAYDSDGNDWIDENDPIYAKLRIWSRADDGSTSLLALGERGVGAIYLGRIATPFSIRDDANQALAEVRTGGVFLNEDGSVGTLQQIDLSV